MKGLINKPRFWDQIGEYVLPILFVIALFAFTTNLVVTELVPVAEETATANNLRNRLVENRQVSKDAAEALNKKPPEHPSSGLTSKTVKNNRGEQTIVSEGNISQENIDYLNQLATRPNSISTPLQLSINDTTGRFANLTDSLRSFFAASLLWSQKELPSLKEIRLVDAGASGWSGMYNGSYSLTGGRITNVTAWVDLNTYYYANSPYLLEYLELTLSHEYGHHLTLFNKWQTYNLPYSVRFPDSYYQTRPLSYATTAPDYSKGWANCDAEILAEDYKYLFSPFKTQGMAGIYGYPSDPGTRNWILAFSQINSTSDTTPPTVQITTPADGGTLTGSTTLKASAADNISVTKVEFYLGSQLIGQASKSGDSWQLSFNSLSQSNGAYSLKAKAYDQTGNSADSPAVAVTIANNSADTTPPTLSITAPSNNQTVAGTFTFSTSASDNVGIQKVQFYMDSTLLQEKTAAPYSLEVNSTLYANGNHILKAIASDGQNTTTKEISINIQNPAVPDTEKPVIQITAPSASPYTWDHGNLTITAVGQDNVGVTRIELYINNTLVATENSSSISRLWMSNGTPAGTYTLKAKAYDLVGNSEETSVTINKQ